MTVPAHQIVLWPSGTATSRLAVFSSFLLALSFSWSNAESEPAYMQRTLTVIKISSLCRIYIM
jgi:hypothetical protein